jgi:hypothetical protein
VIDGSDFIHKLTVYANTGRLKSRTLLCIFDIHNLFSMLPQDGSLNSLMTFLHQHGCSKVKCIALDTIRKLASIVLKENAFVYGKHYYRQVLGGAMGSAFTLTLANVFMWQWQQKLVEVQEQSGELFFR